MNPKTFALTAFAFLLVATAACSNRNQKTLSDAQDKSMASPVPSTVDGMVTGQAGLRAQLIVRRASYPINSGLSQPGILDTLAALVEDDTKAAEEEHTAAFAALVRLAGYTTDGTRISTKNGLTDGSPEALTAVARYQLAQRSLDTVHAAAAARYSAKFGNARRKMPLPAQTFDGIVRLTNDGSEPVFVRTNGDGQYVGMRLSGPGAITILASVDTTEIHMMGVEHTIAPGGHLDIPIKSLSFGNRARGYAAYATTAGTYTLQASYTVAVRSGSAKASNVKVDFPPVKFEVK